MQAELSESIPCAACGQLTTNVRFCSDACRRGGASVEERFWGKVICDLPTRCWLWTGARSSEGYGNVKIDGQNHRAYHLAYTWLMGPIGTIPFQLDHTCHNTDAACAGGPTCQHRRWVHTAHLEPVPRRINLLRGKSPAAIRARQDQCRYGHSFTPENTYVKPRGGRACRACGVTRTHAYYLAHKANR